MKKIIFLAVMAILLSTAQGLAETSLKAEVDKKAITTAENITYKLTIISTEKNIPLPRLPKFAGFRVISQSRSSQISLVKGGSRTILSYVFILMPADIGKFKIEPSSLKIKKETYSTAAFEIRVTPGKSKPKTPQKDKPSLPGESQPASAEPQITL